jgi:hypothetical protein
MLKGGTVGCTSGSVIAATSANSGVPRGFATANPSCGGSDVSGQTSAVSGPMARLLLVSLA